MRFSVTALVVSLSFISSAFATNPNQYRANYWRLAFNDKPTMPENPLIFVQAHVGEITTGRDAQGQPKWDQNSELVELKHIASYWTANYAIEHNQSPYMSGAFNGAVVQFHYFTQGEENQIDPAHPYSGGHWTNPVVYGDPTFPGQNEVQMIRQVLTATSWDQYTSMKTTAQSLQANFDPFQTSVVAVKYDFAD